MPQPQRHIPIPEDELQVDFVRASGPGGQNVNKVSTAVQLRWNIEQTAALPEDVRQRLRTLAAGRINTQGELVIDARNHRTQARNRQEAMERLEELVRQAARPPRRRKRTRPTLASRQRRLESKRQTGEKKLRRRKPEI